MVVEEIRRQEEAARYARAVSQPQQGRWMRWNGTAKKKISWSELWSMESNRLSFIIKATYDILPTPANLHLWLGEDPACPLCAAPAGLKHILVGCKTSLSQGRYTWRHNQVLRCLASAIEEKRTATNAAPPNVYPEVQTPTAFIREDPLGLHHLAPFSETHHPSPPAISCSPPLEPSAKFSCADVWWAGTREGEIVEVPWWRTSVTLTRAPSP
ncbi:hypothetical protein MHYP_G00287500 [Metynnis hypsauchen]